MAFIPITKSEARGRGRAASLTLLAHLAERGERILFDAALASERTGTLTDEMILAAYDAIGESWGGITLDLVNGCVLDRSHGYAVTTGTVRIRRPASDDCLRSFAQAVADAAKRVPLGQYLGIFHDDDLGTVAIDSIYVTNLKMSAFAVAVARHSTGGVYNFATGDGEWPPYLKGSE